jgi:hypothetical protein
MNITNTITRHLDQYEIVCPQPKNRTIYLAAKCWESIPCNYSVRVDIGTT